MRVWGWKEPQGGRARTRWDWEEPGSGVKEDPEIWFRDGVKLGVRGWKSRVRAITNFGVYFWPWGGRSKIEVEKVEVN